MKTGAVVVIAVAVSLSGGSAFAQNTAQSGTSPSQAQVFPMPPPEPALNTTPGANDMPSGITTDRHTRCMQYGASIGVPPDRMDDYIKRCQMQ